jgi:hypothetical protein
MTVIKERWNDKTKKSPKNQITKLQNDDMIRITNPPNHPNTKLQNGEMTK